MIAHLLEKKIEQIQNPYSLGGIKTQGDSVTYRCTALHKMPPPHPQLQNQKCAVWKQYVITFYDAAN